MNPVILQTGVEEALRDIADDAVAFAPRLVGALLILLLGWIVGRLLGGVVRRILRRSGLDRRVGGTWVGRLFREDQSFSWSAGKVTAWYIYLIAILAAADVLAITILSEWLDRAVTWLPSLIAGLVIIFIGFILADFIAGIVRTSPVTTRLGLASVIATIVQLFLYFIVLTVGLGTMGVDTTVLVVVVTAFVGALGLAVALGIGLAIGLGGQEHVRANIDSWLSSVDEAVEDDFVDE